MHYCHTAHSQWSERYGQYLKHIAGNVLPRHFGQLGDDDMSTQNSDYDDDDGDGDVWEGPQTMLLFETSVQFEKT